MIDAQGRVQWLGHEQPTGGSPVLGIYRKSFDAPLAGPSEQRLTTTTVDPLSPYTAFATSGSCSR